MSELISWTVSIGKDAYGRDVTMTRRKYQGQFMWSINTAPASQRDDGERMDSLTDDNVRAMANAVEAVKKGGLS